MCICNYNYSVITNRSLSVVCLHKNDKLKILANQYKYNYHMCFQVFQFALTMVWANNNLYYVRSVIT